jgi:CRP-like cAMP-binding protein
MGIGLAPGSPDDVLPPVRGMQPRGWSGQAVLPERGTRCKLAWTAVQRDLPAMKKTEDSVLRRFGWLAGTPAEFQDLVLKKSDRMTVGQGDTVFHAGDDAGGAIGVIEGLSDLHVDGGGSDDTLTHIVGPGYWVGGVAALTGRPRRIGMVARTTLRLIRLPRAEILRMTEQMPEYWRHFPGLAALNLATAIDILDALRRSDPAERLAMVLRNLNNGAPTSEGELAVTQADLASLSSLSRSSVNRALGVLAAEGMIVQGYKTISIPEPAALAAFRAKHAGADLLRGRA